MNIFDLYGIREIADVTLYGITTNKYGDKIYIPVLHFDTLKVSSLDLTSEQTTARGGLGNTEHILWNYGKAVTFNLEDALYTPASLSLMWGGLYGLSKIKVRGRWNPYKYKNLCGYSLERTLNIEDVKKALNKTDLERNKDYVEIYMPCEELNGYAYIAPLVSGLTYKDWFGDKVKRKGSEVQIWYKNDAANKKKIEVIDRKWFLKKEVKTNMEDAELLINNFDNFEINNIESKIDFLLNLDLKNKPIEYLEDINTLKEVLQKGYQYKFTSPAVSKPYIDVTDFSFNKSIHNFTINNVTYSGYSLYGFMEKYKELCELGIKQLWENITSSGEYGFFQYTKMTDDVLKLHNVFFKEKTGRVSKSNNRYVISNANNKIFDLVLFRRDGETYTNVEILTYEHNIHKLSESNLIINTNIDWTLINGLTATNNIYEYLWKNCNISLVLSSSNFNNLATDSDINLCYHNLDFNSNKRLLFLSRKIYKTTYIENSSKKTVQSFFPPIITYIKSSKTYKLIYENTGGQLIEITGLSTKPTCYITESENLWQWQPKIELHTTVSCSIIDYNGDELIISQQIPLGLFYIVEDLNLDTSTISNFIDPMNSGLKDRKVFEKFENLIADRRFAIDVNKNIESYNLSFLPEYSKTNITVYYNPKTMKPYEANDYYFTKSDGTTIEKGNYAVIEKGELYYKWTRTIAELGISLGLTVTLNKWNFPFNFKLVGETYIRNRYSEDYHYQIELDNCAILDNININLASTGEPTTVNIKMKALTNYNGDIGRLTIYKLEDNWVEPKDEEIPERLNVMLRKGGNFNTQRAALRDDAVEQMTKIPQLKKYLPLDILERVEDLPISDLYEIKVLHPQINTIFCLDLDCAVPIVTGQDYTYLRLVTPENEDWEDMLYTDYYEQIKDELEKEDLLIAKVDDEGIIHGFINNEELTNVDFVNE